MEYIVIILRRSINLQYIVHTYRDIGSSPDRQPRGGRASAGLRGKLAEHARLVALNVECRPQNAYPVALWAAVDGIS